MKSNIWVKNPNTIVYIGGDPSKGSSPQLTITMNNPQIIIDHEKNSITILETK